METKSQGFSIGLTGGIGCGKSTVAEILQDLGLKRLDTDRVARDVVAPGTPGLRALLEQFGSDLLGPEGELDREALAKRVFTDPVQRKALEKIIHPLILERVKEFIADCRQSGAHCVIESPLLFENNRQSAFTEAWVVSTGPAQQLTRLQARNGWSEKEIKDRVDSQMPLEQKIKLADRVIENNGDLKDLLSAVSTAWTEMRTQGSRIS